MCECVSSHFLGFILLHLILCPYDYYMHVKCLLAINFCLVTLLSSEQCSQFERFRLQHVQMINKTSSFKVKLIGNWM